MNHKNNEELEAAAEKDPSAQLLWALDRIAAREHNELYVPKVIELMFGILSPRRFAYLVKREPAIALKYAAHRLSPRQFVRAVKAALLVVFRRRK